MLRPLLSVQADERRKAAPLSTHWWGRSEFGGKRYDCIVADCTQLDEPTIHVGEVIGLVMQSAH
jgi:hypothetical protein